MAVDGVGTVHPRERGEHLSPVARSPHDAGSSPRARGTLGYVGSQGRHLRFIPASAGNTPSQNTAPPITPVHPRERGEHPNSSLWSYSHAGSSPRARGTRRGSHGNAGRIRFIPASAGNTQRSARHKRRKPVHPRERGEHGPASRCRNLRRGSSPRARGTRRILKALPALRRFIPASAGNTCCRGCRCSPTAVHPRERGEH